MKILFFFLLIAARFSSYAQATGGNPFLLLPENLAYFNATRTGKTIGLEWQTVNEQNSKGFSVQRKTSGDWETLGFEPTRSRGGNSSEKVAYTYTDANSFKGITQYRVIEMTADGKQKRSEIRAVKGESQTDEVTLYPNPSMDGCIHLAFETASSKDVLVTDVAGRVVKQFDSISRNIISVENLSPGFYFFRITDRSANKISIIRAVVAKQ